MVPRSRAGRIYSIDRKREEQWTSCCYEAGFVRRTGGDPGYGALRALDPLTGERKWEFKTARPSLAGTLSTASGLVFSGDNDGNFFAVDAKTGARLWNYHTGAAIDAAPITYAVDGKQYVLLGAGTTLTAFSRF